MGCLYSPAAEKTSSRTQTFSVRGSRKLSVREQKLAVHNFLCMHRCLTRRGGYYETIENRGSLNSQHPTLIDIIGTCLHIAEAVGVICRMSRGFVLNADTTSKRLLRNSKSAAQYERLHDG